MKYAAGMIDIHSHILYGLDDGARDRDISLAMLKLAAETGTTDIVATPHSDGNYEYQPALIDERIQELNEATGNHPRIHRGCDFHLSIDNVQAALIDHTPYTINGLNYLLVEFAEYFIPPSTETILQQFTERGIIPVITHPERNQVLQNSTPRLEKWIESGCLLQVTAQSLTDRFGREAQTATWSWLRKGMVHVLANESASMPSDVGTRYQTRRRTPLLPSALRACCAGRSRRRRRSRRVLPWPADSTRAPSAGPDVVGRALTNIWSAP